MPVKKRAAKGRLHRITREAVEAYIAGDYHAAAVALGLMPWQRSPLPVEIDGSWRRSRSASVVYGDERSLARRLPASARASARA